MERIFYRSLFSHRSNPLIDVVPVLDSNILDPSPLSCHSAHEEFVLPPERFLWLGRILFSSLFSNRSYHSLTVPVRHSVILTHEDTQLPLLILHWPCLRRLFSGGGAPSTARLPWAPYIWGVAASLHCTATDRFPPCANTYLHQSVLRTSRPSRQYM